MAQQNTAQPPAQPAETALLLDVLETLVRRCWGSCGRGWVHSCSSMPETARGRCSDDNTRRRRHRLPPLDRLRRRSTDLRRLPN